MYRTYNIILFRIRTFNNTSTLYTANGTRNGERKPERKQWGQNHLHDESERHNLQMGMKGCEDEG